MKRLLVILFLIFLVSCAPKANPVSTETPIPTTATTATLIPPTNTLSPTATPFPDVNLESFVFPYDVSQVTELWDHLQNSPEFRFFIYHIVNIRSRQLPYGDSCGYHPGDVIIPLGSTRSYDNFLIDVKLPYSGILVDKWITQGEDDGFTFFIGTNESKMVYLNVYHTTKSNLSLEQVIKQGDYFGSLTRTDNYGGWNETKVHFTLFNPAPNGSTDFIGDDVNSPNILDITSYALPPTMQAMFTNDIDLLITYNGENWCDMTSAQKIDTILNEILPNAGFCVDGAKVYYCGKNNSLQGIIFTQTTFNERSIMLKPVIK